MCVYLVLSRQWEKRMRMMKKNMLKNQFSSSAGGRKVEKEGLSFKEKGNSHFKKRELQQSLHCYSKVTLDVLEFTKLQYSDFQAVFISPWSSWEKQRILTELLSDLDPPKHHAATTLFSYEKEDDPMMDTSLLATCIGNRSAVLYEMNRTQVRTTNLPS